MLKELGKIRKRDGVLRPSKYVDTFIINVRAVLHIVIHPNR